MELVSDARLMELVREPAKELLPAARRASVVQPIVVLLALLPGLLGFWDRSLDDASCRQGLLALDVVSAERPVDWFVTASSSSPAAPVATLLTALGLQVELLSPESRLRLVSYFSSAWLLLCLGSLAKKLDGNRFALLVVGLACGHREFLSLSNSLPPAALPLAFAVLSFRAMLSHRVAGGAWISWPLVASGIALAASWLSDGELAVASWGVLLMASLTAALRKTESAAQRTWGRVLRQRSLSVLIALLSLLVVTSIATAIVIGWESAFSDRVRLPTLAGSTAWLQRLWSVESRAEDVTQAALQMIGAWLGFVLLGVAQIVRGRLAPHDRQRLELSPFLVAWLFVACLCWWVTWPAHHGAWTDSAVWPGFLLLPLLFLAAHGLESLLRREFVLRTVLMVTLLTLSVLSAPSWMARLREPVTGAWWAGSLLVGAVVIGIVWLAAQRAEQSEARRRFVLLSCVAVLILSDVTQGVLSRPRLADDERELQALRRQLLNESPPSECWLITEEATPLRLRFFLRSLWRGTELRQASNWETFLAESSRTATVKASRSKLPTEEARRSSKLVVTWGTAKRPAEDLRRRGQTFAQTTVPHYFQGRLLKSFRWQDRAERTTAR